MYPVAVILGMCALNCVFGENSRAFVGFDIAWQVSARNDRSDTSFQERESPACQSAASQWL